MHDVWKQVADDLSTLLVPHGFRRSGLRFLNTSKPDAVRTIAISKFRWNRPGDFRFQLMVAVYLASGASGEFTFAGCAGRYSLVFEQSAGFLLGNDALLYQVPETFPSESFHDRLRTDLEERILPFLAACDTVDDTIRTLDAEDRKGTLAVYSMQLAIALARLGRMEESRRCFLRTPGDPTIVRQVAARYGVAL